jgi:hypothetical protein
MLLLAAGNVLLFSAVVVLYLRLRNVAFAVTVLMDTVKPHGWEETKRAIEGER